jgi:hypothetical protein
MFRPGELGGVTNGDPSLSVSASLSSRSACRLHSSGLLHFHAIKISFNRKADSLND